MKYLRKTFTLPEDLAKRLGTERNQSAIAAQALNSWFNHRDSVKRVAAATEQILDILHQIPTEFNKQTEAKKAEQTYGKCCDGNRPDPETEITPCPHWFRKEDEFINKLTGERIAA